VQFFVVFEKFTCAYLFQIARDKSFDYLYGGAPIINMAAGRKVLEKFVISFAIETKS